MLFGEGDNVVASVLTRQWFRLASNSR